MIVMSTADATSEAVAATPVKVVTDRYGFVVSNAGTPGASTSASENSPSMIKEATRVKKWQKMLGEIPYWHPQRAFDDVHSCIQMAVTFHKEPNWETCCQPYFRIAGKG